MPIYNGIEFIEESVSSILNQTYKEWELIIGINGHSENSETYKKAFEYIKKTNCANNILLKDFFTLKGKAETLNQMIPYCNYEYIALLDVDDIWHAKKLEIQVPYLEKYDIVGTKCIYIANSRWNGIVPKVPEGNFTTFDFFEANPIINSSVIIQKKDAWWNTRWIVEDYDLWLSLWIQKRTFYNCSQILVKHRIHENSAFNSKGNGLSVPELLKYWRAVKEKY